MTADYRLSILLPFNDATDLARVRLGNPPRPSYAPGAERIRMASGLSAFVGYERATWTYAAISIAQYEALHTLFGYSGNCYVETNDDMGDFYTYTAIASIPDPATLERWGGKYLNVVIDFILLAKATP